MYSLDLKNLAVSLYYQKFRSYRKASSFLGLSKSSIHRWVSQSAITKRKRRNKKLQDNILAFINSSISSNPFITIKSLRSLINERFSVEISRSSIHLSIHKLQYTRKRTKQVTDNEMIQEKIRLFRDHRNFINPEEVISIDETYFDVSMYPKYGYSKRGNRLRCAKSFTRRQKFSVIMAISSNGVIDWAIHKSNINKDTFSKFLRLLKIPHGCKYLLLDNVAFHRSQIVKQDIINAGLTAIYTPPYSPQFNPIEHVFSMIKQKMQHIEITIETLSNQFQLFRNQNFLSIYLHCWRQ
jgi:transposase